MVYDMWSHFSVEVCDSYMPSSRTTRDPKLLARCTPVDQVLSRMMFFFYCERPHCTHTINDLFPFRVPSLHIKSRLTQGFPGSDYYHRASLSASHSNRRKSIYKSRIRLIE